MTSQIGKVLQEKENQIEKQIDNMIQDSSSTKSVSDAIKMAKYQSKLDLIYTLKEELL